MSSLHADVSAHPPACRRPTVCPTEKPHITRIWVEHERQLVELLCGLDRSSRVNRFGHSASEACVEAYAKGAITSAALIAGVFAQGRIIGVVEVFEASRDGIAEVAFAVAADWRRQGIGSDLLVAVRRWAEQSGIRTLRMVISRNNWPMRQFAHKAGARLDLDLDEILADIAA
jgi:GNAT superfamily N-acetyltransferase